MKVIVEFECNEHADHPELIKNIFKLGEQKMLKIQRIEMYPFE